MEDLTILVTNWNQQKTLELCLKTYVKHHYTGEPLTCLIIDNGSLDGSKDWLRANGIPFVDLPRNVGHQEALNLFWNQIHTKYLFLCDSDVEFHANVFGYMSFLKDNCVSVGGIKHDFPLHPRIGPWFHFMDYLRLKEAGVNGFMEEGCAHGIADCSYDCGSRLWEKIQQLGLGHYNIDIVTDGKITHYTQVSTGQPHSGVWDRRNHIARRVYDFRDIKLAEKFIGPNSKWSEDFLNQQMSKGWVPVYFDMPKSIPLSVSPYTPPAAPPTGPPPITSGIHAPSPYSGPYRPKHI